MQLLRDIDIEALKYNLMIRGVVITDAAKTRVERTNTTLSLFEYATTSGIALELPGKIYVNANYAEHYCRDSDVQLDSMNEILFLNWAGKLTEVSIVPYPDYLGKCNVRGVPYSDFVMTHNDRIRVSPVKGCVNRCMFCDSGFRLDYELRPLEVMHDAADVALQDDRLQPKHMLISGGHPREADLELFDDIIVDLIERTPVPVDVMMLARHDTKIISRLHEAGANGLSINLELFDENIAKRIMPEKASLGRAQFSRFVENAVSTFGSGKVRSLIIIGLEDHDSTLQGVELVASLGADPVLSLFKPAKDTPMEDDSPPDEEFVMDVFNEAQAIAETHRVVLGPRCIPCQHNAFAFPDGTSSFYYS